MRTQRGEGRCAIAMGGEVPPIRPPRRRESSSPGRTASQPLAAELFFLQNTEWRVPGRGEPSRRRPRPGGPVRPAPARPRLCRLRLTVPQAALERGVGPPLAVEVNAVGQEGGGAAGRQGGQEAEQGADAGHRAAGERASRAPGVGRAGPAGAPIAAAGPRRRRARAAGLCWNPGLSHSEL